MQGFVALCPTSCASFLQNAAVQCQGTVMERQFGKKVEET